MALEHLKTGGEIATIEEKDCRAHATIRDMLITHLSLSESFSWYASRTERPVECRLYSCHSHDQATVLRVLDTAVPQLPQCCY